ncbi:Glycosyl transferase, family 3-like protein [Thioalkalivibrio nitratireducens DSM 14787]|uniref:Glycosyl transferase, family 3-like protein n=1 Tax=Thioalkalivibrio nitratireducens (strain DSM 14787 / UNIQEM 213 / ALEN2) TaxID=1255043 RepID=L0DV26_THIND|nr:glycosyl transferase family protein [Thioalkalivibrio nitratireducens]AGA33449.1 Glycosyl transferase, family 3-like protein [Thioalkalivibrio nitratireducens DSM 14787]
MVQPTQYEEHPFAQYVRILGKGKNGTRPFTEQEAFDSMRMILDGKVEPVQLGAYMMLMRVKEETREELVGFVRAVRDAIRVPADAPEVDLDWSSYAGKRRVLPWYLLSTLLLAQNGITTFMHGASGHTNGRIYTRDVLGALGIPPSRSIEEACERMGRENFAYLDIEYLCPRLHEIIELRPLMGLRSPVHTVARSINPFGAPYVMQGIFHPGYRPVHQEAAMLLGEANVAVIKGEGGEIERNPDSPCLVQRVREGVLEEEEWPAMFARRHPREDTLDIDRLVRCWRGETEEEYGEAAVVGTAAIALHLMNRAPTPEAATALAREMWQARRRDRLPAAA